MKIIHITYSLSHGGIGTMLPQIANEQCKNHIITIIIVSDIIAKEKIDVLNKKIKIIKLNRKTGSFSLLPIIRLNQLIFKSNADIFHFHSGEIVKYLLPFIWNKIIKVSCVTQHSAPDSIKELKKSRLSSFHYRYAISKAIKEHLNSIGNLDSKIILNGINEKDFIHNKEIKKNTFKIIQIGRLLHKIKGQDILLKAIAILKEQGLHNIEVTFLGGNGTSQPFLEKLIKEYNISDNVHFMAPKPHSYIEQHLCDFNLLIQPSRCEAFGLTIAEGMAAKIPILISDIPAPMEVINQGECGLYFKSDDSIDCAEKIKSIIQNGYDENMIEKAYQRVQNLYSVDLTAQNYLKEYDIIRKKC